MGKRGPASAFKPEQYGLVRRLCMLGGTNEELASVLEISPSTFSEWMAKFPAFKAAVREGRAVADASVAEKLFERAIGYQKPAVHFSSSPDGGAEPIDYTEHYPPDTRACTFWLRNRRRDLWRERVEHEHHGSAEMLAALEAAGRRARDVRRG